MCICMAKGTRAKDKHVAIFSTVYMFVDMSLLQTARL